MYRELLEQLEGYGASVDEGVRGGSRAKRSFPGFDDVVNGPLLT